MKTNKFINYIKKHWRGEFSLKRSFWVHKVLGGITLFILYSIGLYFITGFNEHIEPSAKEKLKILNAIISIIVPPYAIWAVVGTWRSATLYNKQHKPSLFIFGWGRIAKLFMIPSMLYVIKICYMVAFTVFFTIYYLVHYLITGKSVTEVFM